MEESDKVSACCLEEREEVEEVEEVLSKGRGEGWRAVWGGLACESIAFRSGEKGE